MSLADGLREFGDQLASEREDMEERCDRLRGLLREAKTVLEIVKELVIGMNAIGIETHGPISISDLLRRIEEELADDK